MNTRKLAKIISILFIVTAILSAFSMVFAVSIPSASQPGGEGMTAINNVVSNVIFVIQTIAVAAAVIMLMFVGIKFVTASPEGKAEVKKIAVIYVVGAVLLFAATGILEIVKSLSENVKLAS